MLIAYLQDDLVDKLGWLPRQQLLDAIAMGQFTPGPLLSTSTFIGYQIGGLHGAFLATVGLFLPSFLFVAILNPIIPKLRQSKWTAYFLDAVNVSAIGIMAAVTFQLARGLAEDWKSALIAVAAILASLFFRKLSPLWQVAGGAAAGYILSSF